MVEHPRPADVLGVFVKAPEPGRVKTRLARDIGDLGAAQLYSRLAREVIRISASLGDYRTVVWFAPAGEHRAVRAWLSDLALAEFLPQREGGLGQRLSAAFGRHFRDGASRVVVIGSDCPHVDSALVHQAFAALNQNDLVLGPSEDGGFYLIGLTARAPGLFRQVDWSTPSVFRQILRNARRLGLSVATLTRLRDIDTAEDARALGWLTGTDIAQRGPPPGKSSAAGLIPSGMVR